MLYPQYNLITASSDYLEFRFESSGPNGNIEITVQFTKIETTNMYNVGFGVLNDDDILNDAIELHNNDRNKILATIASIIYKFTLEYKDASVFFTGSTSSRTRLYRQAISLNLETLKNDFEIFGLINEDNPVLEPYKSNENYFAFIVKRKP